MMGGGKFNAFWEALPLPHQKVLGQGRGKEDYGFPNPNWSPFKSNLMGRVNLN